MNGCDEKKQSVSEFALILHQLLIELNSPVCLNERRRSIELELKKISLNIPEILQLITSCPNLDVHLYLFLFNRLMYQIRRDSVVEQRFLIRDVMLNFALQNPPMFLISYSMRVIVETVKIDWPHNYPTFIDDLTNLITQKNEVGLALLTEFCDELLSNVLASRRKELKRLYFKEIPRLLELIKPFLPAASPIVQKIFSIAPPDLIPLEFLSVLLRLNDFNAVNELIMRSASPLSNEQLLLLFQFARSAHSPLTGQYYSFILYFIGYNFHRLVKLISTNEIDNYLIGLINSTNSHDPLFDLWEHIFEALKTDEQTNGFSFISYITMQLVARLRRDEENTSRLLGLLSFVSEIQPSILIDVAFQLGENDLKIYKQCEMDGTNSFKDLAVSLNILSLLNHIVVPEVLPWANQLLLILPKLIEYEQITMVNVSIINFISAFVSDVVDSSNTHILTDVCLKAFSIPAQNKPICEAVSKLLLRISVVIRPDSKSIERFLSFDLTSYPIALQAVSNMFVLPHPGTLDEAHDWNERGRKHHQWILNVFFNPLSIYTSNKEVQYNSLALSSIYRSLEIVLSTHEFTTRSRQILCSSLFEIIQLSVQEFSNVLMHDPSVADAMMSFFKSLVSVLHFQLGANTCRSIIDVFFTIFSNHDFVKLLEQSNIATSVLDTLIQILIILVKQQSASFKSFLPTIIDFTFKSLYPVVRQCVDLSKSFYILLKEMLLNHWKMFFSKVDESVKNDSPSEELVFIIKVFADSIISDQIDLARFNINILIDIDSRCSLFKRAAFPRADFLAFLFNRLMCRSNDSIREEMILLIYALVKDDFTSFELCLKSFIQSIRGIDSDAKMGLLSSIKCMSDQPSFVQSLDEFVNDIHFYIDLS